MNNRGRTSILIAALGGQGGGVLTGWIGDAARAEGLAVQATSTPGVSQRTGATSYYVEIAAAPAPGGRAPVLGLTPLPGRVDVLVASELLEAARMLERGMCTPARTIVIASTHRVYTTREKMSESDSRFDSGRIVDAIGVLARRAVLFDMETLRTRHKAAIGAVLFGALAGSGAVPLSRNACEAAVRAAGIGVEPSLAAFAEAFARAAGGAVEPAQAAPLPQRFGTTAVPQLVARASALPARIAEVAIAGLGELASFQDTRYALQYADRVERLARAAASRGAAGEETVREAARSLALWMAYDDVIRVAAVKSRASRFARIRSEVAAREGDVIRVRDFLRPGAAEIAAILPVRLGAWLERRARARPASRSRGHSLSLETSSVTGALAMRLLAALRPLRRHSLRFAREQATIEGWVAELERTLAEPQADAAVLAFARLPRLLKGYGETHAAGRAAFEQAMARYRDPRSAELPAVPRRSPAHVYPVTWLNRR